MKNKYPWADIDDAVDEFRNYWHACSHNATKLDWNKTFRNSMRRYAERTKPRNYNGHTVATSDARFAATQALKDQPRRLELT